MLSAGGSGIVASASLRSYSLRRGSDRGWGSVITRRSLVAPRRRRGVRLLFFLVAAEPRFARQRLAPRRRRGVRLLFFLVAAEPRFAQQRLAADSRAAMLPPCPSGSSARPSRSRPIRHASTSTRSGAG